MTLTVTRQGLLDQLEELKTLAESIHSNLLDAHQRNYLDTMEFYNAAEHVAAVWRGYDYATSALHNN